MAKNIGALTHVGVGKESTRGTAVAVGEWIPKSELSFNDNAEYIKQEAPYGVINEFMDGTIGKNWGAGVVAGPVFVDSIGYILGATFGAFPSASGSATVGYTHVFTPAQNSTHQSLTLYRKDPNEDINFALGMVNSLEITYELGEYLSYSADFISKASTATTPASTPTYTASAKIRPQDLTVKIASTVAGLGAGTTLNVESASITIEKNLIDYQTHGDTGLNDIFNARFSFSGTFVILWDSTTYKALWKAGTKQALQFAAVNLAETVGSGATTNPGLTFTIAPSLLEEFGLEEGNDDIVKQTIGFTGLYDLATGASITATLVNGKASY
jgi:hypothetical protein